VLKGQNFLFLFMSPMCVEATHDKIYLYKIINKYYIDNKDDALTFARATMLVDIITELDHGLVMYNSSTRRWCFDLYINEYIFFIKLFHLLYLNRKPPLHDFSQHTSMPHHQPTTSPNSLDLILIFLLRKPPT
jgi:hypothetical protein